MYTQVVIQPNSTVFNAKREQDDTNDSADHVEQQALIPEVKTTDDPIRSHG
jgi:hypothetical protein